MRPLPAYTFEDPALTSRSAYRLPESWNRASLGSFAWEVALERVECIVELSLEDFIQSINERM